MKCVLTPLITMLPCLWYVLADDVVGVTRVSVPSNDVAVTVLPYSPMGDGTPGSFTSGPFVGNGDTQSDMLHLYTVDWSETTNFVWGGTEWFDPATGTNATAVASQGNIVALQPYGSLPFDFFLFGRYGTCALAGGNPRFSAMYANVLSRIS